MQAFQYWNVIVKGIYVTYMRYVWYFMKTDEKYLFFKEVPFSNDKICW